MLGNGLSMLIGPALVMVNSTNNNNNGLDSYITSAFNNISYSSDHGVYSNADPNVTMFHYQTCGIQSTRIDSNR